MMALASEERRAPRGRAVSAIRILLVLAVAAAALWLTAVAAAAELGRTGELGPSIAPFDARVQTELAQQAALQGGINGREANAAPVHAQAAVRRDPTSAAAWRMLATEAQLRGQTQQAARLFGFVERISRRDGPTQMWLVSARMAAGDLPAALDHADIALRVSPDGSASLYPLLAWLTDNPRLTDKFREILTRQPQWASRFYTAWIASQPSGANAVRLLSAIAPDVPLSSRDVQATDLVASLIERGFTREALQIELLRGVIQPDPAPIRNNGFNRQPAASPFDWHLSNEAGQEARIEGGEGQSGRLVVTLDSDVSAVAATQVLSLASGAYRLAVAGGASGSGVSLRVEIQCLGTPGGELLNVPVMVGQGRTSEQQVLRIPPACGGERLALRAVSAAASPNSVIWVDEITLQRISG